jgi:hypothetical protein
MVLLPGQIIVSDRNKALNLIVSLTDTEFHPYTHAGIISIEQGKPYVYHAIAQLRLLFNGSPTDLTKGVVKRTSLAMFLKDKTVAAIYNPTSVNVGKSMADFAVRSHREKLRYDPLFDPVDRSKVYCSEFIAIAIESAGGGVVPLRPRNRHSSINTIYEWLSITAKDHYFVNDLVSKNDRIALLSERLTRGQIDLYFALREELHRRFTPNQKIGNIMRWTGFGVAFLPQITSFMQRGIEEGRVSFSDKERRDWVMSLANEVLGPT